MTRLRIRTTLDNWVRAAGSFGAIAERIHGLDVEKAGTATFQLGQDLVHRITHSLALSGKLTFEKKRAGMKVIITYGGESSGPKNPVRYAGLEYQRGGPHDWMTPSVVETADLYPESLVQTLTKAVREAFS